MTDKDGFLSGGEKFDEQAQAGGTDLSERKQAETALQRSEMLLREMGRVAQIGGWELDPTTMKQVWTDETYGIHDRERGVYDPNSTEELSKFEPGSKEVIEKAFAAALTQGMPYDLEVEMTTVKGNRKWVRAVCVPWLVDGKVTRLIGTVQDITHRKQAEREIRESEERLALVMEGSQLGYWDWNIQTGEVHRNARWAEMLGYTLEEIELNVRQWTDLHHPDDREAAWKSIQDHLDGKTPAHRIEYRMRMKDGQYKWILDQASIVQRAPDGKPLRMSGTHTDITARKLAEEALAESQNRFRVLIERSTDGIVVISLQARILYESPSATRLIGFTPEERQSRSAFDNIHPDDLPQAQAIFAQLANQPGGTVQVEYRAVHKDGSLWWAEAVATNLLDEPGVRGIVINFRDVTERKQAEEKLRASEEQYRGLMETLDSAVATVDANGKFLYMNEIAARQLGGTPQELAGKTVYELFPEAVASQQLAGIRQVIQEDIGPVNEMLSFVQGQDRWYRSSLQPIHNEHGQVAYALLHAIDIHDLKTTQQELQSRNREMRLLLEAGRALSATLDTGKIYELLYRYLCEVMPCDMLIASSYDPQTQLLRCEFLQTPEGPQSVSEFPLIPLEPPGQGTQSLVIRTGESLLLPDYDQAFKTVNTKNVFDEHGHIVEIIPDDPERTRSAILVPLHAAGAVVGVLQILSCKLHAHTENHLRFLEALAFRVSAALSNAKLFAELEERVRQRTAEVQDLYDNAPIAYHSLNPDGIFILINQTALNWLGYTREEVLGRHFSEFITAPSREVFAQYFPILKQRGQVNNIEIELVRKDASTFPALVNSVAIRDAAGNFVQSRSTIFDNSERKQAELALRESEASLQNFLDTAQDLIQSLDEHGNFLYVNNAWCATLGYSLEETLGMTVFDVIAPEHHAACRKILSRLTIGEEPERVEVIFKTKQGQAVIVEGHVSSRRSANGHLATNGIFRDITLRKQSEEVLRQSEAQLRAANEALEKAARMKDEFLASMSHELRTPLTGILGLSESLQEQVYGALNERQTRAITNIEASGRHLLELINDILDVSKLEAGMIELQMQTCVLSQLCQASLHLVKGMAQKKNQRVSFSITPDGILFQADPRRFKQILINLLSNAVKYTPIGGALGLNVEGNEADHSIQISVWDQGIGIKTEDIDTLFQPFMQIDSSLSREQTGTGLGLTLVQHLVELHGGSINVQSVFGEGSRFTVIVPWVSSKLSEKFSPSGETDNRFSRSSSGSSDHNLATESGEVAAPQPALPLVLVVDDNEANRNLIQDFLSARNFRVAAAGDAAEFFEQLTREVPNLILMDIQMPGTDGLQVIRRLRANPDPQIAAVPVIALTALAMPGDREKCIAAGANDYLSKPVRLQNLADLVQTLVEKP